jgi:hypothetical protein
MLLQEEKYLVGKEGRGAEEGMNNQPPGKLPAMN